MEHLIISNNYVNESHAYFSVYQYTLSNLQNITTIDGGVAGRNATIIDGKGVGRKNWKSTWKKDAWRRKNGTVGWSGGEG